MGAALVLVAQLCLAAYSFDDSGRFADAADWPSFAAMLERHRATAADLAACRADAQDCPGHLKRVRVVLERGATLTREQQLRLVNRFVNNRRYSHDRPRRMEGAGGETRLKSHWQTLGEFLARGGDCEDFALAKYFLLREFGIPAPDMRVVVALDQSVGEHHALLVVRRADADVRRTDADMRRNDADGAWLIDTDNRIHQRKPASIRYVYAVNEEGVWDHQPNRTRSED